jgi:hypothetical protein
MISNQVQQVSTLTQQLQQIQAYVKAVGDPEKLLGIVGADSLIDSLNTSGVGQPAELDVELADEPIAAGSIVASQLSSNLALSGITSGTFSGDGAGLTNLSTAHLSGQIGASQLASNLSLGGTTTGTFSGNGAALTNLNAAQVAGTFGSAQLGSNLTLGGTTSGTFSGNGSLLTNLSAANLAGQLSSGQLADGAVTVAKLGADVGAWSASGSNVFRTSGNVGIGTATPTTALHVAGTVTATGLSTASVNFASPITRTLAIPAAAFTPADSQTSQVISDGIRIYPAASPGGIAANFVAPVNFPDGANVTARQAARPALSLAPARTDESNLCAKNWPNL